MGIFVVGAGYSVIEGVLTIMHASVDTLMGVAGYFRLNLGQATGALAQVTRAVGCWRAVAAAHGLQQADLDVMEPAFEHDERKRAQALAENRAG